MRKTLIAFFIFFYFLLIIPSTSHAATIKNEFVDNHILLSINHEDSLKFIEYTIEDFIIEDILEIRDLTEGYKSIIANDPTYDSSKFRRIFLLIMDYHDCDRILEDIERLNELLDFIEGTAGVDGYSIPAIVPNDPMYSSEQSGFADLISLPAAWNITTGSNDVLVGVIDSGIDASYDFGGNLSSTLGISYVDNNPYTCSTGHGTAVATIIGMRGNNSTDLCGVCWSVTLVSIKVANISSDPIFSNEILGLGYADTNNIKVVNISNNHHYYIANYEIALNNYSGIVIASAGNDGICSDFYDSFYGYVYPQNYDVDNLIVVGNSTIDDVIYESNNIYYGLPPNHGGSNYGLNVDLFAPGTNIPVYTNFSYLVHNTGTSLSAPFVTGVVALMLSINPNLTVSQIKSAILNNVDTVQSLRGLCSTGGRLNAYKALLSIHSHIYNVYTQYSSTHHKRKCCHCNNYILEQHSWTWYNPLGNGHSPQYIPPGSYYICDSCGARTTTLPL